MRIIADAPDGRVFICPDLPQADARIVAWDARCERLIELFLNPKIHFHLENCIRLFGLTRGEAYEPKFKAEDPRYTTGKAMGHAANYRMAAKRLAMEIGISPKDAQILLDRYLHQLYPEIERWHQTIKERIRKDGGLRTPEPFNRWRTFYGAWGEMMLYGKIGNSSWNEATAFIPQSAVADIINVGMERLWKGKDYVRFHLHGHDSYLASVPVDRLGEACEFAMEALKVSLTIHGRPLTMLPEMQWGYNYGLLKEWKGEAEVSYDSWWDGVKGKMDKEKLRKDLYGYY
jgi:DNA polymerase I-like protein with 3'-5' exonuclease and polymerase domains